MPIALNARFIDYLPLDEKIIVVFPLCKTIYHGGASARTHGKEHERKRGGTTFFVDKT